MKKKGETFVAPGKGMIFGEAKRHRFNSKAKLDALARRLKERLAKKTKDKK